KKKANEMPRRSPPLKNDVFEPPRRVTVAVTDPAPMNTSAAVPKISATDTCSLLYIPFSSPVPRLRIHSDSVMPNVLRHSRIQFGANGTPPADGCQAPAG